MKRFDFLGEGCGFIFSAIQTNEIFQLASIILTCIATAFSIGFTIFLWYKEAKKDGKITKEEIEDLKEKIKKGK